LPQNEIEVSFTSEHRRELDLAARERGSTVCEIICDAWIVWNQQHLDADGTSLYEARANMLGRDLEKHELREMLQEAVRWWLENPSLRIAQ
jgi:hypothetical protein